MLLKCYLDICTVSLVVDGLLTARLLRHRKEFNPIDEVKITLLNAFIPVWNLVCLYRNVKLLFSKSDKIKALAVIQDLIQIEFEGDDK